MSCQAGHHTGLAVCLAGVTSATASPSPSPSASPSLSTARSLLSWRQALRQGQFTLSRPRNTPNRYLRVLQTAVSVVAISTSCNYLTSVEPRGVSQIDLVRHSSSIPHLSLLRSSMSSIPAFMSVIHQRRGLGGTSSDEQGHKHNESHSHSHSHAHGHSHGPLGHHHHHDNAYLTAADKSDPGVRITRIGLLSNLGMAVAKFIGGYAFNSKAMTADAWHSLTDLASDILTLATVSWSLKPPTDRFPMGFGKVESLGALGVSGMLLVGGMYMGWESGISLYSHFYPDSAHNIIEHVGHGHSHSHLPNALGIPSMHAAWLAAGTIAIKEWLYHATMKVAKERKSSVLASNAIHHRVDSLTGFVTLGAIMGANAVENAAWLDPVGGLLISFMVIHAGWGNTMAAFYELADQCIDEEVKGAVEKQALKALAKVGDNTEIELRDVSGIKSGQNYLIDLEMSIPGSWSIEHAREIEEIVRARVGAKVRGVRRVRVRFAAKEQAVNPRLEDFIPPSANPTPQEQEEESSDENGNGTEGHKHHDHHNHRH